MLKLLLWLILQAIGQIFIAANVPKMQKQSSHLVTLPNLECLFSMSQTKIQTLNQNYSNIIYLLWNKEKI